jgi:peptidyl-prolyl cis-trans isomerase C
MMHFRCPPQFQVSACAARLPSLWALTLSSLLLVACGTEQASDQKASLLPEGRSSGLKVNDEAVPQLLLDAYARKRGWKLNDPSQLAQVREKTAELVAMAQAARDRGLLDDPQVQADLALERLNMIAGRLIEQATSEPPTDDQLRAQYERELAELGSYEFRVGHILFDQEAPARTAATEALAGDFDALMARYQDESGVRDARELGWVRRPQLSEALRPAVDAATAGQTLAEPIKSEFGWHVLHLYERRDFEVAAFEQVREGMINAAQRKRALEFSREVVEAAKIEGG